MSQPHVTSLILRASFITLFRTAECSLLCLTNSHAVQPQHYDALIGLHIPPPILACIKQPSELHSSCPCPNPDSPPWRIFPASVAPRVVLPKKTSFEHLKIEMFGCQYAHNIFLFSPSSLLSHLLKNVRQDYCNHRQLRRQAA